MSDINVLDLPDDEVDKLGTEWLSDDPPGSEDAPTPQPTPTEEAEEEEVVEEGEPSGEADEDPDDDAADEGEPSEEESQEPDESTDSGDSDAKEKEEGSENEPEGEKKEPDAGDEAEKDGPSEPDYRGEYEKLFAPFKANGKEMKVESVDDARTLMMMGANYNKKMAALKPNLKILKMLENNSLLDEAKLNFLIDLDKKNPDAVKKLIQESGVDPLDLNQEEKAEYKPQSYSVDDKELELDSVLREIEDTSTYGQTIDVISNKWDDSSRRILVEHPQLIKAINSQMENGIFAKISQEMERERMLGRLNGMSDLDAYKQIGDRIYAAGGFSQSPSQEQAGQQPPRANEAIKPSPAKKQPDPKLKDRKRAASPSKGTKSPAAAPDFNPLALSDEEFEKLFEGKYL